MVYSFFFLCLIQTFPSMGHLTSSDITNWGKRVGLASHPTPTPLTHLKCQTFLETQKWVASPSVKKS